MFPTYSEAKDAVWRDPAMLFDIIPEALIKKKNETDLAITFTNGSIFQLKGSDRPDALRGAGPSGVIFDEWDTQNQETWGVVEPILRANGGWAWFIGTPRGKQKLYEFYQRGQSAEWPEWDSWLLRASTSGILTEDELAEAKRSMNLDLYNQEFECAFLDAAGAVFQGVREVMTQRPMPPVPERLYCMGVDIAKVKDFTVIRVYDRETNHMVYSDRFQHIDYPTQINKIAAIARHYNHAMAVVDSTGVGDPVCDALIRAGIAVVPFKISSVSKKEIIEKLILWIEQKKIRLLARQFNQEQALLEYDNFSYSISGQGNIRYEARPGSHDDIVLADALAVWHLAAVYIPENVTREPTPTQIAFARAKNAYERAQQEPDNFGEDFYNEDSFNDWAAM